MPDTKQLLRPDARSRRAADRRARRARAPTPRQGEHQARGGRGRGDRGGGRGDHRLVRVLRTGRADARRRSFRGPRDLRPGGGPDPLRERRRGGRRRLSPRPLGHRPERPRRHDGRPGVADDVISTLVPVGLDDAEPLGWSNDGTELLLKRSSSSDDLFPQEYLYVLHADGSETQLNEEPMYFGGATISPDGSRVVFAAWGDDLGLYIADTEGGRPDRLPFPEAEGIVTAPTFSPDGAQIAYVEQRGHRPEPRVGDERGRQQRTRV